MTDGDWGGHVRCLGHAAGRRPDRRGGRARRADRRRHAAGADERPPRADPVHPAGDEPGPRSGSCCSTRPTTPPARRRSPAASTYPLRDRSLAVFRTPPLDAARAGSHAAPGGGAAEGGAADRSRRTADLTPGSASMTDPLDRLAADADRLAAERRRVPGSTYRLQMHAGFTLRDAAPHHAVPALARHHPRLHVSLLAAQPGSTHGYDVIDHGRLNPEIGTDDEFDRLGRRPCASAAWACSSTWCRTTCRVGGPNEWWADVLEHGPASPFAGLLRHRLGRPPAGTPARQGAATDPRPALWCGDRGRPSSASSSPTGHWSIHVRRDAVAGRPADVRRGPGARPGGGAVWNWSRDDPDLGRAAEHPDGGRSTCRRGTRPTRTALTRLVRVAGHQAAAGRAVDAE